MTLDHENEGKFYKSHKHKVVKEVKAFPGENNTVFNYPVNKQLDGTSCYNSHLCLCVCVLNPPAGCSAPPV